MENRNPMEEIINEAKRIEENNLSNIKHTTSISSLLSSNDLAHPDNRELSEKLNRLNKQIEDINRLTSDLLNDLSSRHN